MRPWLAEYLNRAFGTTVFTYLLPNYWILLCLGAFAGTVYAARRARARGLNPEVIYGLILWAFPAALLGGRIMGFLCAPASYGGSLLNLLDPLSGDSAAYGGFIGGTAAGIGYMLHRRADVWRYLDCAAPALGLAAAFTRVGCFLDGCDFGAITASPIAVTFPPGSPAHAAHSGLGLIPPGAPASLPVHPIQLYLALNNLFLAAAIAWWSRRPRLAPGEAFLAFWLLYAVTRFGLESLRGDAARGAVGYLSTSQAVSAAVFLLAGTMLLRRRAGGVGLAAGGRRLALVEATVATVIAALAVRLCLGAGGWAEALAPAVWIHVPLAILWARGLPLAPHGFSPGAWKGGTRWLAAALAGVLVPFAAAVLAWRGLRGGGLGLDPAPLLSWEVLWQCLLVAVPEEIFFRGYVHGRLRAAWTPARPGPGSWVAIVAGAALFAAAHLIVEPGWMRAAVFFPGLVMGWLRERTGGLLAPAGFHWLANLTALTLGWGA